MTTKFPHRLRWMQATFFLAAGFLVGAVVQRQWPLGNVWRRMLDVEPERVTVPAEEIFATQASRRLVIVVAGQSNAANFGGFRTHAGPGVYAYANGQFYPAQDPMPGAGGDGGSPWPWLGAQIVTEKAADTVVFAAIAVGSSRIEQWSPSGELHPRLIGTLAELKDLGLPPDFLIWQQGESEGMTPSAAGAQYLAHLHDTVKATLTVAPGLRWIVSRATLTEGIALNAQIRTAQHMSQHLDQVLLGPDFDQLGAEFRYDGVHFNSRGLERVAQLWWESLRPVVMPIRNEE